MINLILVLSLTLSHGRLIPLTSDWRNTILSQFNMHRRKIATGNFNGWKCVQLPAENNMNALKCDNDLEQALIASIDERKCSSPQFGAQLGGCVRYGIAGDSDQQIFDNLVTSDTILNSINQWFGEGMYTYIIYCIRISSDIICCISFCPCWYNLFNNIPLRIMQFGYCPGTTQFALKFSNDSINNSRLNNQSFESRSRFKTSISINSHKNIGIEIFDMNIAEFPTMIPSYLESYDPHVILLLFDVADRSSFDGIIKMRKSLENLYESLSEKTEYDSIINPNKNNNLKRFHESFDAIASVFKSKHVKTRSNSVASILSNLSFGLKSNKLTNNESKKQYTKSKSIDIYENNKKSLKKRSRTYSNLNRLNINKKNNIKVNKSNKNEFTIQPLTNNTNNNNINECIQCYYHNKIHCL